MPAKRKATTSLRISATKRRCLPKPQPPPSDPPAATTNNFPNSDASLPYEQESRIRQSLRYFRERRAQNLQPEARIRITIPRSTNLLRQAARNGEADLIMKGKYTETFEIGMRPIPPAFASGISPTWWEGMTPAEIRAGPLASAADVKAMEGTLKGMETRKKKRAQVTKKKVQEIQDKLAEGVRRQEAGEGMYDSDGDDD